MRPDDILEIISQIKENLEFYEELGVESLDSKGANTDKKVLESKTTINCVNNKSESMQLLKVKVSNCSLCRLYSSRCNTVFGEGDINSKLIFIGEAPGADEDREGKPFVGRAGHLLTKIINAMGFQRDDVYIANIIKCRPPGNRNPSPDETGCCLPYLEEQLKIIKPMVICTLGTVATNILLDEQSGITKLRGRFYNYKGTKVLPTFHPAYLLRNESAKKTVWEDVKKIIAYLNENKSA